MANDFKVITRNDIPNRLCDYVIHNSNVHPKHVSAIIDDNLQYYDGNNCDWFIRLCMIDLSKLFVDLVPETTYVGEGKPLFIFYRSKTCGRDFTIDAAFKIIYLYAEDFIDLPEHIEFDLRMKGYI